MDKYEELGFLGESRAGKTKLMRDRMSLELVAAKWVEHKAMDALSKETEREICNHRRLRHPGIIGTQPTTYSVLIGDTEREVDSPVSHLAL
jgi:hypothetical protein